MSKDHFPDLIRQLPDFEGPFDANRLAAGDCDVLFASYPAARLIDIETKMAHQEQLLTELNAVLTDQQAQISRLESLCQSLIDRLNSLVDNAATGQDTDERPPHY